MQPPWHACLPWAGRQPRGWVAGAPGLAPPRARPRPPTTGSLHSPSFHSAFFWFYSLFLRTVLSSQQSWPESTESPHNPEPTQHSPCRCQRPPPGGAPVTSGEPALTDVLVPRARSLRPRHSRVLHGSGQTCGDTYPPQGPLPDVPGAPPGPHLPMTPATPDLAGSAFVSDVSARRLEPRGAEPSASGSSVGVPLWRGGFSLFVPVWTDQFIHLL